MNEEVRDMLRKTRTALQILAEPVDWFSRFMNYKKGYPPLWLRQKVGSLNDFEGSGGEYMAYLKLLCGLKPGDDVLDIGCGCGLMCLPINENLTLAQFVFPGHYLGLDRDWGLTNWCRKHLSSDNTSFFWIPSSESFKFGASHGSYDVVLAKSLFTHLLIGEATSYLEEIKSLLKPGGSCLSTWFLVSEEQARISIEKKEMGWKPRYHFNSLSCNGHTRYLYPRYPKSAVAYEEDLLLNIIKGIGFSYEVRYGSWSGRQDGLSFQDIIILRR